MSTAHHCTDKYFIESIYWIPSFQAHEHSFILKLNPHLKYQLSSYPSDRWGSSRRVQYDNTTKTSSYDTIKTSLVAFRFICMCLHCSCVSMQYDEPRNRSHLDLELQVNCLLLSRTINCDLPYCAPIEFQSNWWIAYLQFKLLQNP